MKEYKLSAKSKYSVLYLLTGLFMFFFMFAILSLNSHASSYGLGWTSSTTNLKTASPRPTSTDGSCTISFGTPTFRINIPADPNASSSGTSTTFSYSYEIYATTTCGTFLLKSGISTFNANVYQSQVNSFNTSLNISNIGSFNLSGQFISADLKLYYDNDMSITDNTNFRGSISGSSISGYNYGTSILRNNYFGISSVNSNFVTVTSSSSGGGSSFPFSDYDSYGFVNTSSPVICDTSATGYGVIPSGSAIRFTFDSFSGTTLSPFQSYLNFVGVPGDYIAVLSYNGSANLSAITFNWLPDGVTVIPYSLDNFDKYESGQTYRQVSYVLNLHIDDFSMNSMFRFAGTFTSVPSNVSFQFLKRKYTIDDYMSYVQQNYNNITPSVTDTNTNTSQTVSDINTVNSFETTTFENFDTLSESSGLNSFSLSSDTHTVAAMNFLSTCIVTVYNGFPSDLKWLIQCVGIFGIFALLLSVFGRVGKRINNE